MMGLTVGQLKEILKNIPDDIPIIMQKDDEGNGYRYQRGLEFIPDGDQANFFDKDEAECYRREDLDFEGRDLEDDENLVLVAVAY